MNQQPDKRDIRAEIRRSKKRKADKLKKLNDFNSEYNIDKLLEDLDIYFEGEVDFNLDKIKEDVQKRGKLTELVKQAINKQTHPVVEFIQQTLKDL
ncbi:MAG: hypothetical protein K9L80_01610 [Candidatus Omnitrophica bacterium]|nr:hypothetical protein [Candidatus Omnitrophota bacterium]MCF7887945.1 hypothetical protein [Candidatus Omnitrophota bacterium]MCF7917113.1 hypothetical protein [Candidatus Omnitrophota bacterium]